MPTCKDLIDLANAELHGWGNTQDRITALTTSIGPGDTTFTVDAAFGQSVGITPGVVEIDSEQLYVTAVDATTGVCTLANGFGRGFGTTTAASHTAGAKIVSRPKFPRVWIFKEMNAVLGALYPQLYAVRTTTTTVTWPTNSYILPGSPVQVLDVQWQDPIGNWLKVLSYNLDPFDHSFRLGSGALIGRPLRIVYAEEPTPFASEADDFTITGLPATSFDVLTKGVVARQVPGLDISRAQLSSVEQSDRSRVVPPNQGINAGKFLLAEYLDRLRNEAQALRRRYKPRVVRVF